MDFIGVGFSEVIVILAVAMIAVGPRRIPELARRFGQLVNKFKMTTTELTRSVTAEVEEEASEIKAESMTLKNEIDDAIKDVNTDKKSNES